MTSNKNKRTQLAIALLITCLATIAHAQPTSQPARPAFAGAPRGQFLVDRFRQATSDLDLTPEQKSKVDEILNKTQNDMQELLPQLQNLPPDERRQKMQSINTDLREKIRSVLTDDQAAKLRDKLQNQRPPNGGGNNGRPGGGPGRPGGPGMNNDNAPQETNAGPIRIQATLQRLNESLNTLDLSADQKTKVRAIVDDNTKQLTDLRDQMFTGAVQPADAREEAPKIFASMRDQLADVLTPDQQIKLRDAIQTRYDHDTKSAAAPTTKPTAPATQAAMMKMDPFSNDTPPSHDDEAKPAPAHLVASNSSDLRPAAGEPAPDFTLETLSGKNVQLSSFKGKPLVIEFGSYSSPSFRQRAAKFDELARQYGNRANFLIVYTAEAHPTGGWEVDRNRDDGIRVPKAADLPARKSAAKQAKQLLKIVVPIATDNMDDKTAEDYSAGENTVIVITRDGKISARETWMDPYRLKVALDEAIAVKPTTMPMD